jgi:hypothetical protein
MDKLMAVMKNKIESMTIESDSKDAQSTHGMHPAMEKIMSTQNVNGDIKKMKLVCHLCMKNKKLRYVHPLCGHRFCSEKCFTERHVTVKELKDECLHDDICADVFTSKWFDLHSLFLWKLCVFWKTIRTRTHYVLSGLLVDIPITGEVNLRYMDADEVLERNISNKAKQLFTTETVSHQGDAGLFSTRLMYPFGFAIVIDYEGKKGGAPVTYVLDLAVEPALLVRQVEARQLAFTNLNEHVRKFLLSSADMRAYFTASDADALKMGPSHRLAKYGYTASVFRGDRIEPGYKSYEQWNEQPMELKLKQQKQRDAQAKEVNNQDEKENKGE